MGEAGESEASKNIITIVKSIDYQGMDELFCGDSGKKWLNSGNITQLVSAGGGKRLDVGDEGKSRVKCNSKTGKIVIPSTMIEKWGGIRGRNK